MRQVLKIEGQVLWEVAPSQEGTWVALCKALGLTMEGKDLEDIRLNIQEAVQLLMLDLLESGELDEFLNRHGWRRQSGIPQKGEISIDVPIDLLVRTHRDSARTISQ